MNLQQAMREATSSIREKYSCSARDINTGMCVDWAEFVSSRVAGALERDNNLGDFGPAHEFIFYHGRFYDAETQRGVKDFRDLPIFRRFANFRPYEGLPLEDRTKAGWKRLVRKMLLHDYREKYPEEETAELT